MAEIELFKSGNLRVASRDDIFIVRVGTQSATLTAGEWARLISAPQRIPAWPAGLDDSAVS